MPGPFSELKSIDTEVAELHFRDVRQNGVAPYETPVELARSEMPAFAELASHIGEAAIRNRGGHEASVSMTAGMVITAGIVWKTLDRRARDPEPDIAGPAKETLGWLKQIDPSRLIEIMEECMARLRIDGDDSPEFVSTEEDYPGIFSLSELLRDSWVQEGAQGIHADYAKSGSAFIAIALRELEKEEQLAEILGQKAA